MFGKKLYIHLNFTLLINKEKSFYGYLESEQAQYILYMYKGFKKKEKIKTK